MRQRAEGPRTPRRPVMPAALSVTVGTGTITLEMHVSKAAALLMIVAAIAATAATILLVRRLIARRAAAAVTAERARLSRELHDSLTQGLTGIRLHVEGALANVDDAARRAENLQMVRQLTRATFVDLKRVLLDLRPRGLSGSDFISALQEMVRTMTHGLPVEGAVRIEGTPRPLPSAEVEHQLFRIAQEAVTNALRHARAHRLDIVVAYTPAHIDMSVRDDGLGSGAFTLAELAMGLPHGGTDGMRARARQIGATLEIARNGSQGLAIHVRVPARDALLPVDA